MTDEETRRELAQCKQVIAALSESVRNLTSIQNARRKDSADRDVAIALLLDRIEALEAAVGKSQQHLRRAS